VFIFCLDASALVGQGLLIIMGSRSHSDTPRSIGHLRTSDQSEEEASTSQHTTDTDVDAPGWIRTRNPRKQASANPHLRPRLMGLAVSLRTLPLQLP